MIDNLYWSPNTPLEKAQTLLKKMRRVGGDENTVLADPKLKALSSEPSVDAGVELPEDWHDPLADADAGKPDIGALPLGVEPFQVGRRTHRN